ncbi:hypothetical protein ADL22_12375 [Streptomyces sp. NRRL F-4489]|uniref:hypothetical protein n=1 Tax=Streptomyces sp. NRRL F-4489 TaxID=1609095 RepID=UPI00074637C8|nr:hypothetical protein [Streptomyces sp. NRRL F-4489]KUL44733.1 hypothetical protein ADL22_12375 [Streptomyces sp. NRRL F-4489]
MPIKEFAPHARIIYPNVPTSRHYITHISVHQAEATHEVAEISIRISVPRTDSIRSWALSSGIVQPEGTPMHLRYGSGPHQQADLYGYVHSYRITTGQDDARLQRNSEVTVTYTLTGPTTTMQSQRSLAWQMSSASALARSVCRHYQLACVTERTPTRLTKMQSAQSDFAFLRDLAQEYGLRLVADATTVYLTSPLATLRRGQAIPSAHLTKLPGLHDTIYAFDALHGELEPGGGRRTRIEGYAYNRHTRHLSRSVDARSATAAHRTYATALPADSRAEAEERVSAASAASALWVSANASVRGDARLKVGTEIWLQGAGLGPHTVGTWMIRQVSHRLTLHPTQPSQRTYVTDLVLGRNRPDGLDAHRLPLPQPASTVLSEQRWCAQYIGGAA